MPPQRRALYPITLNHLPNYQLSPYQCAKFIGKRKCGLSFSEIAKTENLPRSTIQYTIEKDPERTSATAIQRSGRPKERSERDERNVLRIIRL